MEEKETIILDFKIEQGDALTELERTKKSILQLKDEQKELNAEYKLGAKNLDEYTKETVQLEAALKKQSAQYGEIQKKVTGLKSPFDKLNDSIKDQAKSVTVAGVSLQSFLNPATATVAVVGLLGKAYASSTIGAKDLEFASNQLSAATGILTNEFAALVSGVEDGEGAFTKIVNFMMESFGPAGIALAATSGAIAMGKGGLEDLGRDLLRVQGDNNERLADNQELMTKIQDSQTSYNEKIHLTGEMITNLRTNESELLVVKEKELKILEDQLKVGKVNEKLNDQIEQKTKEISRVKSDTERKVGSILRLESNLADVEKKKVETIKEQNLLLAEQERIRAGKELDKLNDPSAAAGYENRIIDEALKTSELTIGIINAESEAEKEASDKSYEYLKKTEEKKTKLSYTESQLRLANISLALGMSKSLFEEQTVAYKALAIGQVYIDTYRAAAAALTPPPIGAGPLFGPILAATTIGLGLANVAKILDVGFASGGYTGAGGKHEVAGTVHKGEVVWSQADVALAGGASRVNSMRPTYSDGGLVTDYMSRSSSATGMANQRIEVSLVYEEFRRFTQGITYKEQATSR